jgi:hypothetical protein
MNIRPNPNVARTEPGDFRAVVQEGELLVPGDLWNIIEKNDVRRRTVAFLLAQVQVFPFVFAQELEWSLDDVKLARTRLVRQLKGSMPDEILHPTPQPMSVKDLHGSRKK